MALWLSIYLRACPSQSGVLSKWLNMINYPKWSRDSFLNIGSVATVLVGSGEVNLTYVQRCSGDKAYSCWSVRCRCRQVSTCGGGRDHRHWAAAWTRRWWRRIYSRLRRSFETALCSCLWWKRTARKSDQFCIDVHTRPPSYQRAGERCRSLSERCRLVWQNRPGTVNLRLQKMTTPTIV